MTIQTADQITLVDLTDAYAVLLTNDSYTFPGTPEAAKPGACTTQIIAMRGTEQIEASVDLSHVEKPVGITVTKDADILSPTLTINASPLFTTAGVVRIPVVVEGGITFHKDFSVAIAFSGIAGAPGEAGTDAVTLAISSSQGTVFKSIPIETTLTAHVYQAGNEINGAALTALGTIQWYQNDGSTVVGTGKTLTVLPGTVSDKATYTARLEGKASACITLSAVVDVQKTTRYYLLQSSVLPVPAKPLVNPPIGTWNDAEPTYTEGSNHSLYFCDLTEFSDGTWDYSTVSISSSYEAAKQAYTKAQAAQSSVDSIKIGGRNYLLKSNVEASSDAYKVNTYDVSEPLIAGQVYTISLCVTPAEGVTHYCPYLSSGYKSQCTLPVNGTEKQIITSTFIASYYAGRTPDDNPAHAQVALYRLPNDGSVTGASAIHWIKVEKGNKATDYSVAPEDTEETVESRLATVSASIITEADNIRSEVQATYAAASDLTNVRMQVSSLSEQTENGHTWSVTQINQLKSDVQQGQQATEEQFQLIKTYMSFTANGLVIGKAGNPFTFRVVNDRLSFYMNDTEVAYLSNNKLFITQAEILSKLQIGKFSYEPQSNGNLSLVYTG